MMRRTVAVAAAVLLLSTACGDDTDVDGTATTTAPSASTLRGQSTSTLREQATSTQAIGEDNSTPVDPGAVRAGVESLPKGALTEAERAGLIFMREEEKLAYDVYTTLGAKWGLRIFTNIAKAELTHTDSVKVLLDRYSIPDPASGKTAGAFSDPTLQSLYTDLVKRGNTSETEALVVGALIEDLDIVDLQRRASTKPDIALVYGNLERGSRNHLRAFAQQLKARGVNYAPSHLSQAAYDAIVNSPTETGPS